MAVIYILRLMSSRALLSSQRDTLKALARSLNPEVKISCAVLTKRQYALEWVEDTD